MRIVQTLARNCLVTVGIVLLLASCAVSQIQNGQITGSITDSSGAIVPNAMVFIQNPATGREIEVESNRNGIYNASELAVGSYTILVSFPGFKTVIAENLLLEVGTTLRVDFKLAVGQHSETIEVRDAARLVNTEDSRLAYTVDSAQIANLPLNGRNVYDLIQYQPGATNMRGILFENGANSVVNGVRENFSGFLVNGAPNTGLSGGPVNRPILDTVEEFQLSSLNNSYEIGGNAGPITNVVTKSGGNHVHGSAWEFVRNDIFDASYFFANKLSEPGADNRVPLRLNQFGATLGAPIRRDKLFFFAAYQGERFLGSSPAVVFTESAEFRQATISAFPNSVAALLYSSFPPLTKGKPFATLRESIDQQFDHFLSFADYLCPAKTDGATFRSGLIAHKFAALFGVEQRDIDELQASCPGGSLFSTPFTGAFNRDSNIFDTTLDSGKTQSQENFFDGNEAALRVDYDLTRSSRLFTQFNWAHARNKYNNASVRGFSSPSTLTTPNFQFTLLHTFTINLLNEFRAGYARNASRISAPLPGVPLVGLDLEGFGSAEGLPANLKENIHNFGDSVSIIRGSHNLKFGGDLRRNLENNDLNAGRPGYFFFDSLFFAIDAPVTEDVGVDPGFSSGVPARLATNVRRWRNWYLGLYAKDDWRISRRLTLNFGLRYDLYTVSKELNGLATTFVRGPGRQFIDDITTGAGQIKDASTPCPGDPRATLAGECGPGGFAPAKELGGGDHNNLGPRAGFAWDVFGDGKTSLRGGYAISYEGSLQKRFSLTRWNLPYYSLNTITSYLDKNPDGHLVYGPVNGGQSTFLGPSPAAQHAGSGVQATGNISGWDPSNPQTSNLTSIIFPNGLRDPYVENWFFGLQREILPRLTVEVNYVGTAGHKLFRAENVNRIPGGRLPEGTCVNDNFSRRLCSQIDNKAAANGSKINPNGKFLNPNYGKLRVWENAANSSYHGMQISVKQRSRYGVQISGNYTYSHSIDDGSSWQSFATSVNGTAAGDGVTTDQTQPGLDRGNSIFDIRHRLSVTYIWEIRSFATRTGLVSVLLRGWQLNGILSFQTGAHWSPYNADPSNLQPRKGFPFACDALTFDAANCVNMGGDYNLDGEPNDRPNAIANNFHPTHSQWSDGFNLPTDFFTAPCLGCVGNLGRNTFVGPGYWVADTSIFRNFNLDERFHLQFRAEAFNVLNHTNFLIGNNTDLHKPEFGAAAATAPPRNLQFGLKLSF